MAGFLRLIAQPVECGKDSYRIKILAGFVRLVGLPFGDLMANKIPRGAYVRIGGRSKYRNVKIEYDGYLWDSKAECEYYKELCLRKKAGEVKKFEVKPKFYIFQRWDNILEVDWCEVWGPKCKGLLFTYTPDFIVDGELVDVKSPATEKDSTFRLKARILKALGMPIKIVK